MAYTSITYLSNDKTCQHDNFNMASRNILFNDLCHLRGVLCLYHTARGRARSRALHGTHLASMDPPLTSTI